MSYPVEIKAIYNTKAGVIAIIQFPQGVIPEAGKTKLINNLKRVDSKGNNSPFHTGKS